MNLLHHCPDVIGTHASLIALLCWFSCTRHSRISAMYCVKGGILSRVGRPIICSKFSQQKPHHPVILQMVHKHPEILFHTWIHSLRLSVCLWVAACQHSLINPQPTAHLLLNGRSKLRASIRNNGQWESMKTYHIPQK